MSIPKPVYNPPFNITRASHSVLTVKDLAASRRFYVDLIGFIVSDEDKDTLYLRGVAEACHHSLVLKRASGEPQAERVGMRVFSEEDLERAKAFFDRAGLPARWIEVPHQGRTLHVSDPSGAPIEFCATMDVKPRLVVAFEHHHGAVPQRIDHFQLSRNTSHPMEPTICCSCSCSAKAIRTTSFLRPGTGRGYIMRRFRSRNPITSSTSAILPVRWALLPISSSARAAMVPAMRSSSTCAIRTDTASSCSIPTTRSWTSRTSRCAGTQATPCSAAGNFRHGGNGSWRRAVLQGLRRASLRAKASR